MTTVDVVHGLLPAAEEDPTLSDLQRHGIDATEIEVAHPEPGRYQLADESLHRDLRGARRGAATGVLAGTVLGIATGLAIPGVASAGADAVAMTAVAFGGFGALLGGMVGLQRNDRNDDDPVRWVDVDDTADTCCVTVHCELHRDAAHRVLEQHGAAFLESDRPTGS